MHFISIFRSKAVMITTMLGLLITSVIIVVAMLMGDEAGNFVVQVAQGVEKSIAITLDDDPFQKESAHTVELQERLVAPGIQNMGDTTLSNFCYSGYDDLKAITSGMGAANTNRNLYIYTFNVVNTCESAVEVEAKVTISNVTKGVDEAIRVMTVNHDNHEIKLYQKLDKESVEYPNYAITPQIFQSSGVAGTSTINLGNKVDLTSEVVKFSLLVWFEGYDPDCNDSLRLGTIKFGLDLKVVG